MYRDGKGFTRDLAKAEQYFRNGAALGYAEAQFNLANLLLRKPGNDVDIAQVRQLIIAASLGGYPDARTLLQTLPPPSPPVGVQQQTPLPALSQAAPAQPTSKLRRIFQSDMLDAQVTYLENITGPAMHVSQLGDGVQLREYRVDGCSVTAYANGSAVVGYSLKLGQKCNINLSDFLGNQYPTTDRLTVGKFGNGAFGANFRAQSDCIYMCGNAADPTVYFVWEGPHAANFLTIVLAVTIVDEPAIVAADRWKQAMADKEGEQWILDTKFNCTTKYDDLATKEFSAVQVSQLTVGYNPFAEYYRKQCAQTEPVISNASNPHQETHQNTAPTNLGATVGAGRQVAPPSAAQSVSPSAAKVGEQFGNIIYYGSDGVQRQVTSEHKDGEPTLSPDGKTIAFIRIESKARAQDEPDTTALWIADGPTRTAHRLVDPSTSRDPKKNFETVHKPTFSPDGRFLYVLAEAGSTTGAVHQVDVNTGAKRFVIDGNSIRVITSGPYRGDLLISRHKYHPAPQGGSYDPVDVVRPDGNVELTVPGTEADDGVDHVASWLQQQQSLLTKAAPMAQDAGGLVQEGDYRFVCPENLPTAQARVVATQEFVQWVAKYHPELNTIEKIVGLRARLLNANHCVQTLGNIQNNTAQNGGGVVAEAAAGKRAAEQQVQGQARGEDSPAIYGNWGLTGLSGECSRRFSIFSPDAMGGYNYNSDMERLRMPPTRAAFSAHYFIRGDVIFVRREGTYVDAKGTHGDMWAYRITSPTTMDGLEIIKSDGTVYDMFADSLHLPEISTVKAGKETGQFVRCGPEADAALAQIGEKTASAATYQAMAVAQARKMIASDPATQAVYVTQWESNVQDKCKYLGQSDASDLFGVVLGTNEKTKDATSYDTNLGLETIVHQEVEAASCSSADVRAKFDANWGVLSRVIRRGPG
jgi:hypothetical protein